MSRAEWRNAPDFAEYAEVLGVRTNQIILASVDQQVKVVYYTPDENCEPPVFRAEMERDADGILVLKGAPNESPGFLDDLFQKGKGGE